MTANIPTTGAKLLNLRYLPDGALNEMKKFGVDFYKTHHIYHKDI